MSQGTLGSFSAAITRGQAGSSTRTHRDVLCNMHTRSKCCFFQEELTSCFRELQIFFLKGLLKFIFQGQKSQKWLLCQKCNKDLQDVFFLSFSHTLQVSHGPSRQYSKFSSIWSLLDLKTEVPTWLSIQQSDRTLSNYLRLLHKGSDKVRNCITQLCGTGLAAACTLGKSTPIRLWLGAISQAAVWHAFLKAQHT